MSFSYRANGRPGGFTTAPALGGEKVNVEVCNFLTSADGEEFISRLDTITSCFSEVLSHFKIPVHQIHSLLILISQENEVTSFCNEIQLHSRILRRNIDNRAMNAGDVVLGSMIADITDAKLLDADGNEIVVPNDAGIVLLIPLRWRKGLFFDFSVFHEGRNSRSSDFATMLSAFVRELAFQEMYRITEGQWSRLFEWGWFPFAAMSHQDRVDLLNLAKQDRYLPTFFDKWCEGFKSIVEARLQAWTNNQVLAQHMPFIRSAVSSYVRADYIGAISSLYPRIEGIIHLSFSSNSQQRPKQERLVGHVQNLRHAHSMLLPTKFSEYLKLDYFRDFDLKVADVKLSRNSHGHGVSCANDYDLHRATVGFMLLDQLHYLFVT